MAGAICCQAHQGMHLQEDKVIAEIVDEDGRPLPAGERGELVVTTIGMEALPLIRYRTGDYTRILPGPCPCGSETLRLDRVWRKAASEIQALDEALFGLPGLVDHRAETGDGALRLHALTVGGSSPEAILARAEERFPGREICVEARPVTDADRALYPGKRVLRRGSGLGRGLRMKERRASAPIG